jgi:nucleoside recognition membrane protein YjiH
MEDNNKEIDKQYQEINQDQDSKVSIMGYVILVCAFLILSGLLASAPGGLQAFDFNSLTGEFGTMKSAAKNTFLGAGGTGAKQGFLFGLTLVPGVMLSLGIMSIVEQTGGLKIARRWLTPIMRPLFGLPGCSSLAMIASMQSTDAGASLTKIFFEHGEMNDQERIIFTQYELSGSAAISNYITIGSAAFSVMLVPIALPLFIILVIKMVGANITRAVLSKFYTAPPMAAEAPVSDKT